MTTDNKTLADAQPGGRVRLGDALLPCPFCGSPARRIDFGAGSGDNEGGSCIECTGCQTSGPVEFGYKENFISNWNRRTLSANPSPGGQDALAALVEACEDMRAASEEIDNGEGLAHAVPYALWNEFLSKLDDAEQGLAARQPMGDQHADDLAVDAFAAAMKAKMAAARAKGRSGWDDPAQCSTDDLSRLLRDHVEKGDPRDVANFCMMLHQRGEAISARLPAGQEPVGYLFTDDPAVYAMPGSGFHHGAEPPANAINVVPLYAAPTPQKPAQVYLGGLDRALGEAIDQRDRYHEVADDLAGHIAAITCVDIGEHSSANCPWQNAIEAAEEYKPAQAVDLWRPIETAPKNGSSMLLGHFNSAGNWRTVRGRWFSTEKIEMEWENADDFEAGWYEESVEADDIPNVWPTTPTHWQPLPAAPVVDSQGVRNG